MQVIERLAPTDGYCRPCRNRTGFRGVSIHNTSNWSNGANALAHANLLRGGWKYKYVSWNYVVDKDYAVRCVPENEVAWCQGDGSGDGNMKTISIEICDNADGNITQATDNATMLAADILRRNGVSNARSFLFQHNNWTGKDCPYDMRRNNPYSWETFINKVQSFLNGGSGEEVIDQILHAGSKVKFSGIFRCDEVIKPNNKYPNGAVGTYKTCYGSPVGVDDYIPCGPLATCNADGSNENYNGYIKKGGYWKCDKVFTVIATELPTRYTPNGVAILEADGVRFRCDCGPLLEV